jgi:TolB protein
VTRHAVPVAAVLVLVAGATSAASARVSTGRTLVVTRKPIASFAQDAGELAWVTRQRERPCRRELHFRRVDGGRNVGLRIGCHLSRDLALSGRTALWKTYVGGGNTELDVAVNTATAGDRRPHRVESLLESIELDTGFPNPDPPLTGAGSLLAYYAEDQRFHQQDVRRVVRGVARTMFQFHRPLALAVGGGRVAAVRQVLSGDGCGCNTSGVWSPDGRKIAFLQGDVNANSIEPAEVGVMNADGSGRATITHDGLTKLDSGAADSALDWSPDGGEIAYTYWANGGLGWTIAVVHGDGTGGHNLVRGQEPDWSPDGSTIAFSRTGGGIFLVKADGSSVRQLTSGGGGPAWSSDGTRLAYTSDGALYVVNADGTGLRQLVSSGPYARNPDWSPGGEIAFGGQQSYWNKGGLWVVNADGSNLRQLTTESDDFPSWSPDGGRILFTSARDDITHVEHQRLELYTVKADGTDVRPLSFTQPAEWAGVGELHSQSGRRLATFRAVGAPAIAKTFGTMSASRSVAVGRTRVAVLSVLAQTGKPQISLFDAATGALRHEVKIPAEPPYELAGVSGQRVVFRTGVAIRVLDAKTLRTSVLAVLDSDPIGLSVSGRRVAWGENLDGGGRIRAITLAG